MDDKLGLNTKIGTRIQAQILRLHLILVGLPALPRWSSPNSLSWILIRLLLLIWHCLQSPFTFLHSASLPTVLFAPRYCSFPSLDLQRHPIGPLMYCYLLSLLQARTKLDVHHSSYQRAQLVQSNHALSEWQQPTSWECPPPPHTVETLHWESKALLSWVWLLWIIPGYIHSSPWPVQKKGWAT